MTDQTRSRDGGNFWMILLIALALIATVIMLFSNSSVWLQVALLAALWAAILGFLLVSRTRRDRDAAEALLDAERREHAAQIEALNARNDAHRASEGLPPSSDAELLREIREELASLRAQLEDLSGREFGYEPAALQAEARRIMEIEARANRGTPTQAEQPQPVSQPTPQPAPQPVAQPSRPEPAASRRWQAPGAEDDTSRIEPVRDQEQQEHDEAISALQQPQQPEPQQPEPPRASARQTGPGMPGSSRISGAPSSDAVAGRVGSHRAPEGRNPLTDLIRERQEELDREKAERERRQREEAAQRERAEKQRREEAELRQREEEQRRVEEQRRQEELRRREEARRAAEARRQQEQREAEERARLEREAREREEQESRGRRRADEHRDGSLTVAELLARSKKGQ